MNRLCCAFIKYEIKLKFGEEKSGEVLKYTLMRARVEKMDVLGWNKSNQAPESPLVTQGNYQKESLVNLEEIFRKATTPAVPSRVPFRGAYQEKLQQVNQERTQMKISSQSKPFNHADPLMVPNVETYTKELQPVHLGKHRFNF